MAPFVSRCTLFIFVFSGMRATLPVAGPATFPEIPLVTLVTSGF